MKKRRAGGDPADKSGITYVHLDISEIYGGVAGTRTRQEDEALSLLAASIARHGLLQPVVVRRNAQMGRYALVCGSRRIMACRLLGRKQIDAVLLEADEAEAAACFMEEHLCRREPAFLDEAEAAARVGTERVAACFALPQQLLRRRVGLLGLSEPVRREVLEHGLSLEQAEPLLAISREDRQREAASIIAQRGLSGIQARRLVMGERCAAAPRTETGKRRALRAALRSSSEIVGDLTAQGVPASVTVHSQDGGMCIQISIRTP